MQTIHVMRTAFRSLLRLLLVLIHLSVVAGLGSGEYPYVYNSVNIIIPLILLTVSDHHKNLSLIRILVAMV